MSGGEEISANERNLRGSFDYFNQTLERVLAGEDVPPHPWTSPEIVIRNFEPSPFPGTYYGQEGAREWTRDVVGNFTDVSVTLGEVVERGNQLVARLEMRGIGRGSGAPGALEWGALFTVEDGVCTEIAGYYAFEDALAAMEG